MNEKTPACLGVGVLVWVFVAMYIVTRFRNFHGGRNTGRRIGAMCGKSASGSGIRMIQKTGF